MSNRLSSLLQQKLKPKQKVQQIVRSLNDGDVSIGELVDFYSQASDSQKGSCLSALADVTKDNPEFVENHVDFVIDQLSYKAPRVKWEAGEIIANIADMYKKQTSKAIISLLENSSQKNGTVVRWSAAFALTEIARANKKNQVDLLKKFEKIMKEEKNNGVLTFYKNYLKEVK